MKLSASLQTYLVRNPDAAPFLVSVKGRNLWALERLMAAGPRGCTPIDQPGPRWSAYTLKLRRAGLVIEALQEPHGGPYGGRHGRYVLRSRLQQEPRHDGG